MIPGRVVFMRNDMMDRTEVHMRNGLGELCPLRDGEGRVVDLMRENYEANKPPASINEMRDFFVAMDERFAGWFD